MGTTIISLPFLNIITSWMLVGLIWTIQLVHYPTFRYIDSEAFLDFHKHHTFSITLIVMPLMLIELGLASWLAYDNKWALSFLVPFILVLLIWISTFFVQIPMHNQLAAGKDLNAIQRLVSSNWIRTILWTGKALWLT